MSQILHTYTKIFLIVYLNKNIQLGIYFLFAKSANLNPKVTNMGYSVYFKSFLPLPALTTKINTHTKKKTKGETLKP